MLESVSFNPIEAQEQEWSLHDAPFKYPSKKSSKYAAQLFFKRESVGPKLISTIAYSKNLLQLKGIQDIEEVILEPDHTSQRQQISKELGLDGANRNFPVIYVDGVGIGTVSDLEAWVSSGESIKGQDSLKFMNMRSQSFSEKRVLLENEASKALENEDGEAVQELKRSIGRLDQDFNNISSLVQNQNNKDIVDADPSSDPEDNITLSKTEITPSRSVDLAVVSNIASKWGMNYVGSAISSVANYFTLSSSEVPHVASPRDEDKNAKYLEFEVIQINWYWRQQKRLLRFASDKFFRLNPFTKEMRAVHKYTTIQRMVVTGKTFLTIYFSSTEDQPEYYQSADLSEIVQLIINRSRLLGHAIPVNYVEEN